MQLSLARRISCNIPAPWLHIGFHYFKASYITPPLLNSPRSEPVQLLSSLWTRHTNNFPRHLTKALGRSPLPHTCVCHIKQPNPVMFATACTMNRVDAEADNVQIKPLLLRWTRQIRSNHLGMLTLKPLLPPGICCHIADDAWKVITRSLIHQETPAHDRSLLNMLQRDTEISLPVIFTAAYITPVIGIYLSAWAN